MRHCPIVLLLALTLLTSCSYIERYTPDISLFEKSSNDDALSAQKKIQQARARKSVRSNPSTTSVDVEKLAVESAKNDVEILWEIPTRTFEGYIIRYGYQEGHLEFQERVLTSDVESHSDPQFGTVYRYVLESIPPDKELFVSIAAFDEDHVYPPSDVFTVPQDSH